MNISLGDFNKLHINAQTVLVGLLINMPFWYFIIYQQNNLFYTKQPFYLPIVGSFCLSIGYMMYNLICLSISQYLKGTYGKDERSILRWSIFLGLIFLLINLSGNYLISNEVIGIKLFIKYQIKLVAFFYIGFTISVVTDFIFELVGIKKKKVKNEQIEIPFKEQ